MLAQGKKLIDGWTTPEQFTNGGKDIANLPHKLTSLVELRSYYKERIAALGFVWDKETKAYTDPSAKVEAVDEILAGLTEKEGEE